MGWGGGVGGGSPVSGPISDAAHPGRASRHGAHSRGRGGVTERT